MKIEDLNILIVEDEVLIAEYLKNILLSFGIKAIKLAHEKASAEMSINENSYDLILLDIRMEDENQGIEIAEYLSQNTEIPFIFLTAHSDEEMIQNALNTNPFSYLTKPLKKMDIYAVLNLILKSINDKSPNHIVFKEGIEYINLKYSDLLFAKSIGNYLKIYTTNKNYNIRYSMEWLQDQLPKYVFKRSHRSFLVNVSKIDKSNKKFLTIGANEIPISRNFSENFI